MAQNFDQAKRDNTFWPTPNILGGSVSIDIIFAAELVTIQKSQSEIEIKSAFRCSNDRIGMQIERSLKVV